MGKEKTKLGKFLASIGEAGIKAVGEIAKGKDPISAIISAVTGGGMTQEEAELAFKYHQEDLKDTQDARKNETERDTSENTPYISKIIHEVIAIMVTGSWILSWWIPAIVAVADPKDAVMLILGYLYGRTRPQK